MPIRTLLIQIDKVQREELFTQLRKFSEKNNLDFYLSFYNSKETFFVEMYGETFEISGLSVPGTPEIIDIAFYEKDPSSPPTQETVDELFSDLKVFLGEIPSVTITEEK